MTKCLFILRRYMITFGQKLHAFLLYHRSRFVRFSRDKKIVNIITQIVTYLHRGKRNKNRLILFTSDIDIFILWFKDSHHLVVHAIYPDILTDNSFSLFLNSSSRTRFPITATFLLF